MPVDIEAILPVCVNIGYFGQISDLNIGGDLDS